MQLPVYIINLDSRPDRWAAISDNLRRIGVEGERIPAVDAELLGDDFAHWKIDHGAAACTIGHGEALRRFLYTADPAALVLEDDAELSLDTGLLLHNKDWWPAGTHAIQLHEQINRPGRLRDVSGQTPSGRELRPIERWGGCAAAYLIDRKGARRVLRAIRRPTMAIDRILFDLRQSSTARRLRSAQVVPAMARQRFGTEDSDLERWRREERLADDLRSRLRRLRRNLKRMPYAARLRVLYALGTVRTMDTDYAERPPRA